MTQPAMTQQAMTQQGVPNRSNTTRSAPRSTLWLLMAALACFALTGCGFTLGGPSTNTQEAPMPTTEFSLLNEQGVAQIKESKSIRLDFRTGALIKHEVGLPDSAYGPELVAPRGQKFLLSIVGSEDTVTAETDHVRFTTTDTMPTLDIIYYFLTADTGEEYFALVREGVEKYGIDRADAENWIDSVKARPDEKHEYVLTPGFSPGFGVTYDLRYDGSKATQVIIVSVSAS